MITPIRYILVEHFSLAVDGAILLAVGLFAAVPVVKYRLTALQWVPLRMMDIAMRLIGDPVRLLRVTLVIWLFNSAVMFVYMASGFHPLPPKIFAIWTGLNIGVVLAHAGRETPEPGLCRRPPVPSGGWRPPRPLTVLCALMVPALELPCFFYAIALGMRMGAEVAWGGVSYTEALAHRASAFASVIVPVLLVSAFAEAIAIGGGAPEENGG